MSLLVWLNRDFAMSLRRILKVAVALEGEISNRQAKGNFIVSNHLSYIDGVILGSIFKVIFVSKSQVKKWPFFGIVANLGGTIFIDRSRKDLALEYTAGIKELLGLGVNILLFPEGTSTNGVKTLPFQSLFFASPIEAGADIIPVTVIYTHLDGKPLKDQDRDRLHWYGQVPFQAHLWQVLSVKSIGVKIIMHNTIRAKEKENTTVARHNLAQVAQQLISNSYKQTLDKHISEMYHTSVVTFKTQK
ncbi:MAG: 1-acyl-sn-glycerol-3-phosphate acyltransferase [Candidatus Omnitrophica bacterium]|nr:1-acyl-sn-glycerol-3-phosphate acyltransferase [Candidatus Omnitrophota bacterium]